ncbi:MAG TPA: XRE family transcriptional regulator [Vicinamibacterales bacterium]|jgi:Zn-dependent peptidase ImmA (M78 family)/transcriptional regulator with XRE-family HTH domain
MVKTAPKGEPESNDLAFISPRLITWAIKRSRLSHESIANRLRIDVDLLKSWESRASHPSFAKAQALAKLLHVPFGFLYLKEPPEADLPLPDFRGFDRAYRPSPDLLELLNDTLVKQDWFRDHQRASAAAGELKFVGSFTARDPVDTVASAIRARLGITASLRESVSSWSEYLTTLTRRAEDSGVLVMRSGVVGNATNRPLKVEELQGFAIADPYAPVVFVNSADFRAAQVFTLAHELAHIWIGATALAMADELDESVVNKAEAFCNHVAAQVLVPHDDFEVAWGQLSSAPDIRVGKMARRFWVSTYVTLRRAHELGKVNREQYEHIKKIEGQRRRKDDSSGGNYYRNVTARMSPRLTDAVLGELVRGKLEWRDAASLLSMKVPTLAKFAEKWK